MRLDRMQHRGGIAADGKTGDGCGLLMQKPDSFFRAIAEENSWQLRPKIRRRHDISQPRSCTS